MTTDTGDTTTPDAPICAYCGSRAAIRFRHKYYCVGCAVEYAIYEQEGMRGEYAQHMEQSGAGMSALRSLEQIVETARDGQRPSEDECYFAMLAMAALCDVLRPGLRGWHKIKMGQMFAMPPKPFLGGRVPGNVEYDAQRRQASALIAEMDGFLDHPDIRAFIEERDLKGWNGEEI